MPRPLTDTERLILDKLREVATSRNRHFIEEPTNRYYEGSKDATDQILSSVAQIIKVYGGAS